MTEMTSLERVTTALEHREPDRVPLDLGGALVAGININALRNLKDYWDIPEELRMWDKVTQLAHTPETLIDRMGVDVINIGPKGPSAPGLTKDLGLVDGHYRLIDEFGIGWQMPEFGGHYYDLYLHPLRDAESAKEIESYPWPDPLDPARYEGIREKVDDNLKMEKAFVCGRMTAGMWEHATWMMGHEKFFMEMMLNKPLIHALMEKILEIKMKYWQRYLEIVGEHALVISTADDMGTQNSLLVSLELYKEMIWPYHRRLFEFLKKTANGKVYIFFHNDGAIYDTIPLLIEAGVDILNPWQVNCSGMDDTARFKREYGKDLTIWGGSCDATILEFGTPEDVRVETRRRIEDLSPDGGFIFAPIHIIQGGVPPQNIEAWWETHQEFGEY